MKKEKKQIFVFGSNLSGIHGAGAAKFAMENHGAEFGVGVGPTGDSYAIPTKDYEIQSLQLSEIRAYVDCFIAYAKANPLLEFYVTAIGCGLAGFKPYQIAPMFEKAPIKNCVLSPQFKPYIQNPNFLYHSV